MIVTRVGNRVVNPENADHHVITIIEEKEDFQRYQHYRFCQ